MNAVAKYWCTMYETRIVRWRVVEICGGGVARVSVVL